ncbi:hypothetical protein GCM10010387_22210 [Streptomyces inusitatus]|uniref:Uncharacterized protein n=1 Tax=Streptomyces inusitatus TaxID=68221 RepID=A0A918PZ85_9ACTN|nr:hypothetical protein [Streptomyces inusitatus]GGZ28330.1 hypothetical protein GCM10010387_22210 [Streptomyces inusitatus]
MDDHGDDLTTWLHGQGDPVERHEEEWERLAMYVRHAANKVGPHLPLCLPREPQECGRDGRQHALAWAAALKAAAQHIIETNTATPAESSYYSGQIYLRRLTALRAQPARHPD